jgi:hypothetical protein
MGYLKEKPTSLFKKWGLYVSSVDSPQLEVDTCWLRKNRKKAHTGGSENRLSRGSLTYTGTPGRRYPFS